MALTLAKALTITPLDRCRVVGGAGGLHRIVSSVNIISPMAPGPRPWIKGGELIFPTGGVFKDDIEEQIRLFHYLNNQGCAGLAVNFKRFLVESPEYIIREADLLNFPLIEIPYELPWSDIIDSLIREIVNSQRCESERSRCNAFLTSLLRGELHGEDFILARGTPFGLLQNCDYTVINISFESVKEGGLNPEFINYLIGLTQEISSNMGVKALIAETDDLVILLQIFKRKNHLRTLTVERDIAQLLLERFSKQFPNTPLAIGIGNRHSNIVSISNSYIQAKEAVCIGRRVTPHANGVIYEYEPLCAYATIQLIPEEDRQHYVDKTLGRLLEYDKDNHAEFMSTLEIYLTCGRRITECAQRLHVHRNTVIFRITRIKELLETDIDDGDTAFRLQLALNIWKLDKFSYRH